MFNRFVWQYIFAFIFIVYVLVSYSAYDELVANIIRFVGFCCVIVGVIGRLYATIFIGGMKNEGTDGTHFIDYGAYSLCRNPLYFFSFIAFIGLVALKAQLSLIIIAVIFYLWVYHYTIKGEENFLRSKFGSKYEEFLAKTSRFFPKFKDFYVPYEIKMRPEFFHKELMRSINWFFGAFALLLVEILHQGEFLPNLLKVY
ncbi:hypothetical protein CQA38_06590 [Campylobacter sp. MIT 12-5580]|uniref:methyltransferase family protein n=1 Tax=Campylobacter sp. MIT 12-5580 TaxID=2040651 RepID=UPI0010F48E80|nr:isoprenylcysteine carboxylmethyltransferase family protein [Campylobacter sp. MIT 12-5580]TKX28806.1 hypothetical protein CQA38_06590 [Campylobacter sp. MIT 12-5580]